MTMFWDWLTVGVEIGVKAFFAAFTFAIFALMILSIVAIIVNLARSDER